MKSTSMNTNKRFQNVNQWKLHASAAAYLAGWKVVRLLSEPVAYRLFSSAAVIASRRGRGMDQLRRNLTRVVGAENVDRALVKRSMQSYARYWCEAFRLSVIARDPDVIHRVDAHAVGVEQVNPHSPMIIVLPHSGNWDLIGMYFVKKVGTFTTVAERVKPESLFRAFVNYRRSLGFEVLPLTGSETSPYSVLLQRVREGRTVCLLGERDLTSHGVEVEFFGETTRMPAGAVKLALDSGAPLHVAHTWFEGDDWGLSLSEPVEITDVKSGVQAIAQIMEKNIKAHPEDWHLLQPLWINDLDRRRYESGLQPKND